MLTLSDTPLYVFFVDFANAFGSLPLEAVTIVLNAFGVPQDIVRIVANLIKKASETIKGQSQSFALQWTFLRETR